MLPLGEFGLYAEFGTLPDAGGVGDQHYILMRVLDEMKGGWAQERAYQQARERQASQGGY